MFTVDEFIGLLEERSRNNYADWSWTSYCSESMMCVEQMEDAMDVDVPIFYVIVDNGTDDFKIYVITSKAKLIAITHIPLCRMTKASMNYPSFENLLSRVSSNLQKLFLGN